MRYESPCRRQARSTRSLLCRQPHHQTELRTESGCDGKGHFFTGLTVVEIKLHDHVAGDGGLCGEMGPDSLDKSWLSFR